MWVDIIYVKVNDKQLKKLDRHKIKKHKEQFEKDLYVMPIDVVRINDNEYNICGNGRHRYFGALEAGMITIEVTVLNE